MTLADLVLWALATYGLTFGIKDAKITLRPRNFLKKMEFFEKLFSCTFCTGFWAALAISILWAFWNGNLLPTPMEAAGLLVKALAGASSAYIIDLVVQLLELAVDRGGDELYEEDDEDEEVTALGPADEDS